MATDLSSLRWATVPQADFSTLGDLQRTYIAARREGDRDRVLAGIDPNNPQSLATLGMKLMQAGDVRGAAVVAGLNNDQRDFAFRQSEAQRAQQNADRQFGLQQQAAQNPNIQKDENGNFVRINKDGTAAAVLPITGAQAPNNPFAPGVKQTEGEANAGLYARRMFTAEPILRSEEQAATDLTQRAKAGFPLIGNYLVSDSYQKFDQARRDFINATLRRESGAVISPQEFDNAERQYFARPGDNQETLAQKQRNRQEAMSGIAGAAGKGFQPPHTFGPNGEIVPTGTVRRGQQAAPKQAADGNFYVPDPNRPGKYLQVVP